MHCVTVSGKDMLLPWSVVRISLKPRGVSAAMFDSDSIIARFTRKVNALPLSNSPGSLNRWCPHPGAHLVSEDRSSKPTQVLASVIQMDWCEDRTHMATGRPAA